MRMAITSLFVFDVQINDHESVVKSSRATSKSQIDREKAEPSEKAEARATVPTGRRACIYKITIHSKSICPLVTSISAFPYAKPCLASTSGSSQLALWAALGAATGSCTS